MRREDEKIKKMKMMKKRAKLCRFTSFFDFLIYFDLPGLESCSFIKWVSYREFDKTSQTCLYCPANIGQYFKKGPVNNSNF